MPWFFTSATIPTISKVGSFTGWLGTVASVLSVSSRPIGSSLTKYLGQGLVDDGDFARAVDFLRQERAATEQMNLQGREIAIANQLEDGLPFFGVRFACDIDLTGKAPVRR